MLPFWCSGRGGLQVRVADRDDISVAVMFCGEPLGTAWKTTKNEFYFGKGNYSYHYATLR